LENQQSQPRDPTSLSHHRANPIGLDNEHITIDSGWERRTEVKSRVNFIQSLSKTQQCTTVIIMSIFLLVLKSCATSLPPLSPLNQTLNPEREQAAT
jgi:hypothetical protein